MKNLPVVDRRTSVDGWVWECSMKYVKNQGKKIQTRLDDSDSWMYGLNTQGLNNISHHRSSWFHNKSVRPNTVVDCPIDVNKTIPKDIIGKLRESRKFVKLHRKTF